MIKPPTRDDATPEQVKIDDLMVGLDHNAVMYGLRKAQLGGAKTDAPKDKLEVLQRIAKVQAACKKSGKPIGPALADEFAKKPKAEDEAEPEPKPEPKAAAKAAK